MNRGWKRGTDQVASPRAAEHFTSPSSMWMYRTAAVSLQANPWDWILVTGGNQTITLPIEPAVGDQVFIYKTAGVNVTISASPGQSIQGITALGSTSGFQAVLYQYIGSGTWLCANGFNTGSTPTFTGTMRVAGVATLAGGSNTSTAASPTTPTLGAAAQVSTSTDVMLYIVIGTAGTAFTIAMGPTSGVGNTIVNSVTATSGTMYTIRLPAGWYIAVTGTTATWTATSVPC